jgi:CRP-like cAMP-binding protein
MVRLFTRTEPVALISPASKRRRAAPTQPCLATEMPNLLVRKLEALSILTDADKRVLGETVSQAHVRKNVRGEDLVHEGDSPPECTLLLEGFACRYKLLPDGKRQIVSFQIAGDIVDIPGFVLGRMDHSIGALTSCRVALIPHRTILDIAEAHPRIARALWKDTLIDAAVHREWITGLGRRSAYGRMAHMLCEMAKRLETVGLARDGTYEWPMTQAEMGDALGLSTVHVNRTLQELRADGLISLEDSRLIVHDSSALEQAGGFTAGYLHLEPTCRPARRPQGWRAEGKAQVNR